MINKNNYEEYFLMYADGELSHLQQKEVLQFIEDYPEYKNELDEIRLTKLNPEPLFFQAKESLLMPENSINETNYSTWFLSFIDNELLEADKLEVEKFLLNNPQYSDEFSLLKKMILPVEKIEHPNKKSLLKHRKLIKLSAGFIKTAIAASLMGLAILIWQLNRPDAINQIVVTPSAEVADLKPATNKVKSLDHPDSNAKIQANEPVPAKATERIYYAATARKVEANVSEKKKELPAVPAIVATKKPEEKIISGPKEIKPDPGDLIATIKSNSGKELNNAKMDESGLNMPEHPASLYATANYKVVNTSSESDESLYVGAIELNKNKVRGILKKIGSTFKTNSSAEDSGNEIRIATFQIQKNQ